MSYTDYLAKRGYVRAIVQRTDKGPGDLVLHRIDRPVERVSRETNVFAMRRGREG